MSPSQAQTAPDMWLDPDADPREGGPTLGDERATVLEYLRVYRLTLRIKCDGLSPEQLATRSVPPSTMSLLGLVRHLAKVEQSWFRRVLAGQDVPRHYVSAGDPDGDFDGAVPDPEVVRDAFARWDEEIRFAEDFMAEQSDLSRVFEHHGEPISMREVLVHMVEEYVRHCGHADLLRECIDGRTGQ